MIMIPYSAVEQLARDLYPSDTTPSPSPRRPWFIRSAITTLRLCSPRNLVQRRVAESQVTCTNVPSSSLWRSASVGGWS